MDGKSTNDKKKKKAPVVHEVEKKKTNRKARKESFSRYIFKVLRQTSTDIGISSRSMIIMNSFVMDMFERIVREAVQLMKTSKKHTLSSREIQSATMLLLPGELGKHAVTEAMKAMMLYAKSKDQR